MTAAIRKICNTDKTSVRKIACRVGILTQKAVKLKCTFDVLIAIALMLFESCCKGETGKCKINCNANDVVVLCTLLLMWCCCVVGFPVLQGTVVASVFDTNKNYENPTEIKMREKKELHSTFFFFPENFNFNLKSPKKKRTQKTIKTRQSCD